MKLKKYSAHNVYDGAGRNTVRVRDKFNTFNFAKPVARQMQYAELN